MSWVAIGVGVGTAVAGTAGALLSSKKSPDAPDYAAATREGIEADIDTLPLRRMIQSAASAGQKITYTDSKGKEKTADFTGYGDADLNKINLDASLANADTTAAKMLELQKKYGADFVKQRLEELKISDPTGFATREAMGKAIQTSIEGGQKLDAGIRTDVIETERAGQAARGNIMGQSSGAAEAMEVGNAGFRLWQQKLANASAFLSGTTPTAQFGSLSGAQQGASPFNPVGITPGIGLNPNAGAASAGFAQNNYGQQSKNWMYSNDNDPWQNLLGSASGVGLGVAGDAIGARTNNYYGTKG